MKRLFVIYLFLSAACSGCKKAGEVLNLSSPSNCRIKSLAQNSVVATIDYRSDGRLSRIAWSNGLQSLYKYEKDTVTILNTQSGAFSSRYIVVNNATGLAEKVRYESNASGTAGYIYTFQYNGTEVTQSTQKPIGSPTTVITIYVWENGNLKQLTSGSSSTSFEYYPNKQLQEGDYLESIYLSQGFRYIKNKNLVKAILTSSSYGLINYDFDPDGKITNAEVTGTTPSNVSYTYQCN